MRHIVTLCIAFCASSNAINFTCPEEFDDFLRHLPKKKSNGPHPVPKPKVSFPMQGKKTPTAALRDHSRRLAKALTGKDGVRNFANDVALVEMYFKGTEEPTRAEIERAAVVVEALFEHSQFRDQIEMSGAGAKEGDNISKGRGLEKVCGKLLAAPSVPDGVKWYLELQEDRWGEMSPSEARELYRAMEKIAGIYNVSLGNP